MEIPPRIADDRAGAVQRGVDLAVALTDARANQLDPDGFAQLARSLATELGLGIRITAGDRLAAEGFGGIVAIGAGSSHRPALVELWWAGAATDPQAPPRGAIALAGKGITFDSGGLSMKDPAAMYGMHTDCAGAAAVLGAIVALAELGCDTPVYAALPLAENMPGPGAVRPGDVVRMRNGIGLEIVDTDFEGRVVLADALALLQESRPRAVISLATLTLQAVIALGPEIAALIGRDDALAGRVLAAAARAEEPMWALPWAERYASQIRSIAPGATYRNHPRADSGRAITAALLLGAFLPPETPFVHVDFAGPAVTMRDGAPTATGYGVRTLIELVTEWPGLD
ncbi:M17 family metallopeptidase [Microbacterium capsulatum]|uniref:Probable cytosol aminopeptidase n=1 Tax=Microbacterium capsulatum TaxID=3041921 RepID=A0ABU0XLZ8_9MICO|nr:M17 family metallopeptidase [Microbacterium sp. ASV81]MDQ4215613.1 M17 family metallopeptidase [Microbacterium sp. ASV81]